MGVLEGDKVGGESKEESQEVFKMAADGADALKSEGLANKIGSGLDGTNANGGIPIIGMRSSIPDSAADEKSQAPETNVRGSMIFGKRQLTDIDGDDFRGESVQGSVM